MTLADFYALPIRDALAFIEALAQTQDLKSLSDSSRLESRLQAEARGNRLKAELRTNCEPPQVIVQTASRAEPRSGADPVGLVLDEVRSRLAYLNEVGLGYLTLDRPTRSLSGGETERVNLTTCLGTRLVNTLFVLDEPSVGLHPRDTEKLVGILQHLREAGNTVVVVEHEASVMRAADQIIDLGPGHGATGGQVVFQGTFADILKCNESLTGQYLGGRKRIEIPERRPVQAGQGSRPPGRSYSARRSLADMVCNDTPIPIDAVPDACAVLRLAGISRHNLNNLVVEIPLGRFVCVTGVSGSGKTTLVREVLLPALEARLRRSEVGGRRTEDGGQRSEIGSRKSEVGVEGEPESEDKVSISSGLGHPDCVVSGWETLGRAVLVDQSILGKTPRSNPAVYIGAFDDLRELFAQSEPAKQRGLNASAFSFNSAQGQCERCRGAGFEKIEMQFLSDVFIRCPDCGGRRYRQHVLEVRIRKPEAGGRRTDDRGRRSEVGGRKTEVGEGTEASKIENQKSEMSDWSIADMLDATVDEAIDFLGAFSDSRPARRAVESLKLLQEVGLGYLRLGQPINTLSGGESQRLKLVRHLADTAAADVHSTVDPLKQKGEGTPRSSQHGSAQQQATLFLFDEPTTGLHFDDVRVLLKVFQRLVDAGHSVVVIEHNLDVIKSADWIIDLGPGAGDEGGRMVAQGTPETVASCGQSHTGRFLREVLDPSRNDSVEAGGCGGDASSPQGERAASGAFTGQPIQLAFTSPATWASLPHQRDEGVATTITIRGAREHNLKNLSLSVPRDTFVVLTGVSGSGKSTLAFDILFAEGQRRFLDSMNLYARQFVEQFSRPDVDLIAGIPPTVSIEQRNSRGGGKSTVATVTEIYHFVRLLFARLGTQFCPECQMPVEAQTRDEVGRRLRLELKQRGDLLLLAPVVKNRKGFHTGVAEWAARHGYGEIRADGKVYSTREPFRLDRFREHSVEILTGVLECKKSGALRLRNRAGKAVTQLANSGKGGASVLASRLHSRKGRLVSSLAPPDDIHEVRAEPSEGGTSTVQQLIDETLELGQGTLFALDNHGRVSVHSIERSCPKCGRSFEPLDPKNFSYNSPQGWCPRCRGFGELFYMPEGVDRGTREDAIAESWYRWQEGEREICPECRGARLNPEARAVRLIAGQASGLSPFCTAKGIRRDRKAGPTIGDFSALAVEPAFKFFGKLKFAGREAEIARDILPEIRERLSFLREVGLGYLQLGRGVPTLSGGESQRIRLAAQLGSNLSGVLYILDEPTIGLHARDNEQLLATLGKLKSRGNSIVLVEHDEATMRRADYIVDLGPGAGVHGGELVAAGTLDELMRHPESITGQCLRTRKTFPTRGARRLVGNPKAKVRNSNGDWLVLQNASKNNLKGLTVRFPLGRFVCVTGVSGSGKSTLIRECLLPALESSIKNQKTRIKNPGLAGFESIKAVYEVDQSPIGRTPRSVPATYVGFFDDIRRLFAQLPEARLRGYSPGRFSFNSPQGRCPQCEGAGQIKLEMSFLPPAFVRCETCGGSRFNPETLDIEFHGMSIAQVLDLSVEEAMNCFSSFPKIKRPLQGLCDTGLGYLKLGQTSPTLSGGEAQRVKLVTHLLAGLGRSPEDRGQRTEDGQLRLGIGKDSSIDSRPVSVLSTDLCPPSSALFLLEEPTIGLHMADVSRLVAVLQRLVDAGHSVIVIEHNLDLIAEADWIIDLGPEGGDRGGRVVAEGTPEQVSRNKRSHTGKFLRSVLGK